MKLSEFVKKMLNNFLIIFASIIIFLTILRQVIYPDMAFDLKSIYIIMACSFLSALSGFILYSPNEISEKNMRIRMVIHFFALEILVISLASVIGIVSSAGQVLLLAMQVAVIYLLVRLLTWQTDKKDAREINERLEALKKDALE